MAAARGKKVWFCLVLFLFWLLALAGCGNGKDQEQAEPGEEAQEDFPEESDEDTPDTELYILLYSNPDTERLFLQSVNTGRQEEFAYNGGTYIYNRYGDSTTISRIPVGTLVYLSYTDKGMLTRLEEASDTFLYEDITSFSQNQEQDIFTILGSSYYYDEDLKVFSQETLITLNEVSGLDALTIRGKGKRIISIVVSRGHGTLVLKNTEVFEGGMIVIGNMEARVITADMKLELPEGTYPLSVANNGYGGSCEVTVNRMEEQEIDLNLLKGEGPQYCQLKIKPEPENAVVTLDGVLLDCSKVQNIRYGAYQLAAKAEGYDAWSGKLVVSSAEAEISVKMTATEDDEKKDSDKEDKDSSGTEDEKKESDGENSAAEANDNGG